MFDHSENNILKWNAADSDPIKCLTNLFPILGVDEELALQRLDIEVLQDLTARLRDEYAAEYSADLSRQLANKPGPDKLPTKMFTTSGFQIVYTEGQVLEIPEEGTEKRNFSLPPKFSTFEFLILSYSSEDNIARRNAL